MAGAIALLNIGVAGGGVDGVALSDAPSVRGRCII
jgi:hypothetical protein